MSLKRVCNLFLQNGRKLLFHSTRNRGFYYIHTESKTYFNKIQVVKVGEKSQGHEPKGQLLNYSETGGRFNYFINARRIFVNNILNRVTNTLAADLRRRTAKRLSYGDSAPFFALVGVSLASGTGILTKNDEFEGVCYEIRDAVSKVNWNKPQNDKNYEITLNNKTSVNLQDFEIGPLIAKGCSGVVYAAKTKNSSQNLSKTDEKLSLSNERNVNNDVYPLVIKMMFNYDAESNAFSILRAMHRETVPSRKHCKNEQTLSFEEDIAKTLKVLPPHPNVVTMYYVFTDRIPVLPESLTVYPDALPTRINPMGSGRNMSLFLVMKRYDCTLREYLKNKKISLRESILLLAQLLEGVLHINLHGIAHRDLKSDNILLDVSEENDNCASLVITDFGSCLADKSTGLYLPYNSFHVERPGNVSLMAPEVINAEPGVLTSINYTKADLWTVGTMAYEIFGMPNPFYSESNERSGLSNKTYADKDLPDLPENIPEIVSSLVKNILSRNLYKRLSAETAATVMQLYLWAPNSWFKKDTKLPSSNEIMQWLLCLTTKILCEGRVINFKNQQVSTNENNVTQLQNTSYSCGRRTMPEYQLIASFLSRVRLNNIFDSLKWIQSNVSLNIT